MRQEAENELEEKVLEAVQKHGAVMRKDVEEASRAGPDRCRPPAEKMSEKGLLIQRGQGKTQAIRCQTE